MSFQLKVCEPDEIDRTIRDRQFAADGQTGHAFEPFVIPRVRCSRRQVSQSPSLPVSQSALDLIGVLVDKPGGRFGGDFPKPLIPAITTSFSREISGVGFFKLCWRASTMRPLRMR